MTKRKIMAAEFARALGLHWTGRPLQTRCPAHEDHNPSLSINAATDGSLLAYCHAGCAFEQIIAAVPGLAPGGGERAQYARVCESSNSDGIARRAAALRIWRDARPAAGSRVQTYLEARSVWLPDGADLRFAPRLKHKSGHIGPAMVGAIRDAKGEMKVCVIRGQRLSSGAPLRNGPGVGRCHCVIAHDRGG